MALLAALQAQVAQWQDAQSLVVAYSGGIDSHVLLHALTQCDTTLPIKAVHVHHGISDQADAWQAHCQTICQQLNIPLDILTIKAKAPRGESQEAYARQLRYQALAEYLPAQAYLLTAQHQDDQAETLFLQLIRGAGVAGLAGMPYQQNFGHGALYRPLLNLACEEIEHYAAAHHLQWVEDESNSQLNYDRNFIRHEIMPKLQQRWPAIAKTFARSAKNCASAQALLAELANNDNCQGSVTNTLAIDKLLNLSLERRINVIRHWLQSRQLPALSAGQCQQVLQFLTCAPDSNPLLKLPRYSIRRYQNNLYAVAPLAPLPTDWQTHWRWQQPLSLPDDLGQLIAATEPLPHAQKIYLPQHVPELIIKFRSSGEKFHPAGRIGSHPLKKLFQEWQIAPWQRARVPLVYVDNELVGVVGYAIATKFTQQNSPTDKLIYIQYLSG